MGATEEPVDPADELMFLCLGGGNEVGRSCHIIQYKGKTVMVRIEDSNPAIRLIRVPRVFVQRCGFVHTALLTISPCLSSMPGNILVMKVLQVFHSLMTLT